VALLLLMGVGPLLPWRRATKSNFRRNMLVPTVVSVALTAVLVGMNSFHLRERLAETSIPFGKVPLALLLHSAKLTGVYATLAFFGVFFVLYTMAVEYIRGTVLRARSTGEGLGTAFVRLVSKNRRRYGGYVTHIGFALLFLGFTGTGLKTEIDMNFAGKGQSRRVEDKLLTFQGFEHTDSREFEEWFADFQVQQLDAGGQPVKDLGRLRPSRRFYHGANVRLSRTTTEKDELTGLAGNTYLSLVSFRPGFDSVDIVAHYNPMIIWMWVGGAILLLGVAFAIWPDAAKYPVFAAARRRAREEAAEAAPAAAALARQSADG
jgi:cytochrome c-type biogenesis protein CcmF